jgi:hypothetical protein
MRRRSAADFLLGGKAGGQLVPGVAISLRMSETFSAGLK